MSLLDDYQLLEIPTTASEQEAKIAFRRLARRYHPDKNQDTDTTELFQRLQAAYENVINAIRQGHQVQDWKPFTFTKENTHSSGAKNRYTHFSNATDKEQEAFVKERQRAYEEMKRNNAHHEKTRNDAIKAARHALKEKRAKALYEEALEASKDFSSQGYRYFDDDTAQQSSQSDHLASSNNSEIPSYQTFVDSETQPISQPFRLSAAKAAFRATTYLACFAAGIYSTLYWQSSQQSKAEANSTSAYVSGLYPQFRLGANYTIQATTLYAEPSVSSTLVQNIPEAADLQSIRVQGNWLAVRYQETAGWVQAKDIGFGEAQQAQASGCFGLPGVAPQHGELIGQAQGNSRLRILNQLPQHSLLTFESYDGQPPFSIYLYAKQAYAANYIPRGNYRLVLQTGSLYHHACNQFLFNNTTQVILDPVDFASTEQSLTLTP